MAHRLRSSGLLICAVAACAGSKATVPSSPPTPATSASALAVAPEPPFAAALDRYVASFGRTWGEAYAFSGYVGIARDGRIVFGKGYGFADREQRTLPGPDTQFLIGSTTKAFTAIAILQLEERGLLHVDDPVRRYLPELPAFADGVTLRHLLTHTSGLPPLPNEAGLVAETGDPHALARAMERYGEETPLFKPGERFEYANAGYTLLGAVLERVSGRSYEAYMRKHVFGPAGMIRTTTVGTPPPPARAVGYDLDGHGGIGIAHAIDYVLFGCGAIWSTANDLVAFDHALGAGRLLRPDAMKRMFAPDREIGIAPFPARYALGWMISDDAGHTVQWHPGGVDGFQASFSRVPDAKVTVVVLANHFGDTTVTNDVAHAAERAALTGDVPAPEIEPTPHIVDSALASELVGDYDADRATRNAMAAKLPLDFVARRSALSLSIVEGHLVMAWADPSGPEVFEDEGARLFTREHDFSLRVERGNDRRVRAVVLAPRHPGNRLTLRYARLADSYEPPPPGSCPTGMVRIPGNPDAALASFCLDSREVTVADYAACVRSGRCKPASTSVAFEGLDDAGRAKWNPTCNGARADRGHHPINCVDWSAAARYCEAQGKRLPSAPEWTWAAQGADEGRTYPWGERAPNAQLCWSGVTKRESTCPVGTFPRADARGGLHDVAGNVNEWTSSAEAAGYVVMSSAWYMQIAERMRSGFREAVVPWFRGPGTGFRCAR